MSPVTTSSNTATAAAAAAATTATVTTTESVESTSVSSDNSKTIILIRHAESEENRRAHSLMRCFGQLGRMSLPSYADLSDSWQLLQVQSQVNSNVSDVGREQIEHMQVKLRESNFLQDTGVTLVAHSPLKRAKQTSEGMLGCAAASAAAAAAASSKFSTSSSNLAAAAAAEVEKKAAGVNRVVELPELIEKTPAEWIPLNSASLYRRIASLETWLGAQPEPVIALVGHSQFFKAMLGLNFKFGNCEVWQVTFDAAAPLPAAAATAAAVVDPKISSTKTTPSPATSPVSSSSSSTSSHGDDQQASSTPDWTLPPRWSNLKRLYSCDVSRTKPTTSPPNQ